ncbi:TPA: site-specific DNA-methyltransferase, partial [Candidatus Micrarchaeota archaeon]|nr:site-specific DNA-methyltransferase [Candidatus Micrarchaeota archaeon]
MVGTTTRKFGSGKRESHDSSPFYSRKVYSSFNPPEPSEEDLVENPLPNSLLDKIIE